MRDESHAIERGFLLYSASRFVQKKGRRGVYRGENPEYTENVPNIYPACLLRFTLFLLILKGAKNSLGGQ
jgi:hypothetical protein